MTKAIFFDRDGIVNFRIVGEYVTSSQQFKFMPDFFEFFKLIKEAGYLAILITNQQGIGKKIMSTQDLFSIHDYMQSEIKTVTGFEFDDIYYCPDLEISKSSRRKPAPGMILEAIEKWDINKYQSWMIGDRRSDILAGQRAGVSTALIGSLTKKDIPEADFDFRNFKEFSEFFKIKLI